MTTTTFASGTKIEADWLNDADAMIYQGVWNTFPTTPASAAATGTTGMVVADGDYIYVCTATDTWKRVAIATWP